MVSGYNSIKNFKELKRKLAIVLCASLVLNNTLPILAETTETSSIFEVAKNESVVEEEKVLDEENNLATISELEVEEELEEEIKEEIKEEPEEETGPQIATDSEITEETQEETEEELEEELETHIATDSEIETSSEENIASDSEIKIVLEEDIIASQSEMVLGLDIATQSELVIDIATESELDKDLFEANDVMHPTGLILDDIEVPVAEYIYSDGLDQKFGAGSIPSAYDSREHTNSTTGLSYIPAIRDQGSFGTCWVFSTIAMFEASLRVKGLVKNETESDLSEAALSYYTYGLENITNNPTYMDSPGVEGHDFTIVKSGNFASRGGNQTMALFSASAYVGVLSENSDTSYSRLNKFKGNEKGYTLDKKYAFKSNNYVLENAYIINKANTDLIKEKIMENGAVGISYFATQSTIPKTGEDVYMHKNGSEYYYFTNMDYRYANHGIAIVGWDDNIPADRFYMIDNGTTIKAKKPGGWLCRNSWGEYRLANKGYFWMSYEEPGLATNMYAVDAIKAGTYKYNYHYDTTGFTAVTGDRASSTTPAAFGNVFKVPNGQTHLLEAANVAINTANTVLTVDVYTNDNEMTNPSDGTLKSTVTVERQTAGIFTIPLKDKVVLNGGTYFSIIVRGYSKSANSLKIYYDTCGQTSSVGEDFSDPITFYNSADVGQSFLSTYDASSKTYNYWTDVNPMILPVKEYPNEKFGVNLRIKALANPTVTVKISFDSDGGEGTMNELTTVSNLSIKLPQNIFTKKGYKFDKWVDQNGNEYADKATIDVSSNLSLKAVWIPVKYTIKYNPSGGSVSVSSVKKTYGVNITLETPTKKGYKFGGWFKESALLNKYDGTNDITTNDNVNVYLYAKWTAITYIIHYDLNGVSAVEPASFYKTYLVNVTLAKPTTEDNYVFAGWYKDKELKNVYNGQSDLLDVEGEVTIYAKWVAYQPAPNPPAPSSTPTPTPKPNTNNTGGSSSSGSGRSGGSSSGGSGLGRVGSSVLTDNTGPVAEMLKENKEVKENKGPRDSKKASIDRSATNVYNSSYATWTSDGSTGKWSLSVKNLDGSVTKQANGFVQLDGYRTYTENNETKEVFASDTYFFDEEGNMVTGWVQTSEDKWYYFNTSNTSEMGKMAFGWTPIDGAWYFFALEGSLYRNTTTPDGFVVDESGKLVN